MADAANDLISLAQATAQLPAGTDTTFAAYLITGVSKQIARYLGRYVVQATYDEIRMPMPGDPYRNQPDSIHLHQYPLISVARVAGARTTALTVSNTDATTNQRASIQLVTTGDPEIQLTSTGVTLTRVASAVTTTATLTWAAYPTVTTLAAAINALGGGWLATPTTALASYASADLIAPFAPLGCLAGTPGASLDLFATDLSLLEIDRPSGTLLIGPQSIPFGPSPSFGWPNATPTDSTFGAFGRPVRVTYSAGWATVPEQIQQACLTAVQDSYYDVKITTAFKSKRIGDLSYEVNTPDFGSLSDAAMRMLAPFRRYTA